MKFSSVFTRLKGMPSVALLAMACSAFSGFASAAPFTWTGNGADSLWSTAANWSTTGSSGPAVTGSTLIFSGQNRTASSNNLTLTTGTLSFANTSAASTGFVLTGSSIGMNSNSRIVTSQLAGSGTVQEEIANNLTMNGAMTIVAAGTTGRAHNLLISGNLSNGTGTSNAVTISSGSNSAQVILSGNNTNTGIYTVNTGGILTTLGTSALNSQQLVVNGTVNSNGAALKVGPLSGAGVVTTQNTGATEVIASFNAANSNFSGQITDGSGTVSLTKNLAGNLTLSGSNTYTGATTINAGGLTIGSNGSISSASVVTISDAGTLNYGVSGGSDFNNTLNSSGAGGTGVVNITTDSAVGIGSSGNYSGIINTGSSSATFTGNLANAAVNVGFLGNLNGTGTVGNVSVDGAAGIVSAGLSGGIGQLNVGSLAFVTTNDSKSVITNFDIVGGGGGGGGPGVAGTDYDTIVGTGLIDYGAAGSNLIFDFSASNGSAYTNWTQFKLLDFANYTNIAGLTSDQLSTVANNSTGLYGGLSFIDGGNGIFVADAGNSQTVEFYASTGVLMIVPEPSSIILAGLGMGLAGFRTWRNRRLKAILNRAGSLA